MKSTLKILTTVSCMALSCSGQTITSVTSAASGLAGPVSPGELVVLNGSSLGPSALSAAQIPGTGTLPSALSGVSVTFNGIAAPIVYASSSRTSVQVPYGLAGANSAAIVLRNGTQSSPALAATVAPAVPALFTLDYSGAGQVVALNTNGLNSLKNPAAKGTSVLLYATGEGVSNPAGVDGAIQSGTVIRMPAQQVSVQIGGADAPVLFAGSVAGGVTGVLSVGIIVPASAAGSGAVPVTLAVGGVTTIQKATIAIQ